MFTYIILLFCIFWKIAPNPYLGFTLTVISILKIRLVFPRPYLGIRAAQTDFILLLPTMTSINLSPNIQFSRWFFWRRGSLWNVITLSCVLRALMQKDFRGKREKKVMCAFKPGTHQARASFYGRFLLLMLFCRLFLFVCVFFWGGGGLLSYYYDVKCTFSLVLFFLQIKLAACLNANYIILYVVSITTLTYYW